MARSACIWAGPNAAAAVEAAVDAEEVEADGGADRPQRREPARAEHTFGVVQERRLFPLHPWLICHVGIDVMELPIPPDAEVIGKNLLTDEDEPVLAEMTVGGQVVDIFDQVVIVIDPLR